MKQIVITTDGSLAAQAAIEDGLELARDHGARVTFVTVRPVPTQVLGDPSYERTLRLGTIRARGAIEKALAAALDLGVEAEAEILAGDAADEIVRAATARAADLIVVGRGIVERELCLAAFPAMSSTTRAFRSWSRSASQPRSRQPHDPRLVCDLAGREYHGDGESLTFDPVSWCAGTLLLVVALDLAGVHGSDRVKPAQRRRPE